MSWRIETANPFALLSELPDDWAQTCFLRPPRDLPTPCLIAILDRVRRVLRDDGTLWLSLPGRGSQPQALQLVEDAGWLRQDRALHRSRLSLIVGHSTVALFTKQQEFHFNARLALARPGSEARRGSLLFAAAQPRDLCPATSATRVVRARRWRGPIAAGGHRLVCSREHLASRVRGLRHTLATAARRTRSASSVAARLLAHQRPGALPRPRSLLPRLRGRRARRRSARAAATSARRTTVTPRCARERALRWSRRRHGDERRRSVDSPAARQADRRERAARSVHRDLGRADRGSPPARDDQHRRARQPTAPRAPPADEHSRSGEGPKQLLPRRFGPHERSSTATWRSPTGTGRRAP